MALVFLAFAGMETTRNQLGLALQTLLAHPDQWRLLGERPELGAQRGRGGDAGQPDGHLGDPRGARGRRVPGPAHPEGRHRADAVARGRHRPARGARPVVRHHRSSGRRTTASAPAIHHCLGHFVARTDMAVALPLLARRMPDADARRPRRVAAGLGQHRRGVVPDPVQPPRRSDVLAITGSTGAVGGQVASGTGGRTCATTSASSCATPRGRRTTTPTSGCASTPTTRLPSRPSREWRRS